MKPVKNFDILYGKRVCFGEDSWMITPFTGFTSRHEVVSLFWLQPLSVNRRWVRVSVDWSVCSANFDFHDSVASSTPLCERVVIPFTERDIQTDYRFVSWLYTSMEKIGFSKLSGI